MALTQISTAGVKDDAVTAGKIPANAVGSSELADNAVDTAAIAAGAVTGAKLADNSVSTDRIVDGAVNANKLGSAVVTTAKIADNAITGGKMADNAINTAELVDGGITTAKIANSQITADKIASGAVNTSELADGGITTAKIANSQITAAKLASDSVTSAKINDQAVTLNKLPHGDGSSNGKFLRSNNGADPTWETVTGTTINNNADNRVITGSGTANTLEAESEFINVGSRVGINSSGGTITDIPATSHDTVVVGNSSMSSGGIVLEGNAAGSGNLGYQMYKGGSFPCARVLFEGSSNELQFHSTSTTAGNAPAAEARKIRIMPAGHVIIDAGNLQLASGHGIDFSATGHTSGNTSELFDDYEEGTWTPTDGSGASLSFSTSSTCVYTKIGRMVYLQFDITYPSNSSTYDATISGIPFNQSQQYGSGVVGWTSRDNAAGIVIHVDNSHRLNLMDNTGANSTAGKHLRNNEMTGHRLIGIATYLA